MGITSLITGNKKTLFKATLVIAAMWVLYQIHDNIKQAGINECRAESAAEYRQRLSEYTDLYNEKLEKAIAVNKADYHQRLNRAITNGKIKTDTDTALNTINEAKQNAKSTPETCDAVIDDINGMLEQINTITPAGRD